MNLKKYFKNLTNGLLGKETIVKKEVVLYRNPEGNSDFNHLCLKEELKQKIFNFISSKTNINKKHLILTYGGIQFKVRTENVDIVEFCISQLPGCCGVCVFHWFRINPSFRGLGIGTFMLEIACGFAIKFSYYRMILTDVDDNDPMKKIIESRKDSVLFTNFTKKKTGKSVNIHAINLNILVTKK